ncbi:uncharacterized protein I303_105692 [Kwoniella dejecticola CBS 10117]|uniref:alpha-L-rhamnosidase n=1 Tax=Kwoniella dejecticola CBS 10117 TaxID=1296121 RepID=A0A1A6A063_9TREE|nr:uncharacterized protein I303_05714 [Kwoniella dejecticola CBS 10117]OBR83436.1 hypothetical protein I303_05714 [Kwoniella dejecticola CBS 10117]
MVLENVQKDSIGIDTITFEHSWNSSIVHTPTPRISWSFQGLAQNWTQISYDIVLQRSTGSESYHVRSSKSNLVSWPFTAPLKSREIVEVRIKAYGADGMDTDWHTGIVEASLLNRSDWVADMISGPGQKVNPGVPRRPTYFQRKFDLDEIPEGPVRLYATSYGTYDIHINGKPAGDQVLKPGWTSYDHRLYFQVCDVQPLLRRGENTITGCVGEGWYSGRLGFLGGKTEIYGDRIGLMAQIIGNNRIILKTDNTWTWGLGSTVESGIYDGEVYDAREADVDKREKQPVEVLPFPRAALLTDMAPIRRVQEVKGCDLITTASGKKVIDFGQNLVGWVRIDASPAGKKPGDAITLTHAEVLENGEIAIRPLRVAKCQDKLICGTDEKSFDGWEPTFTYHGFRYVQVDGWSEDISCSNFTAVVIHTDMLRTGWFHCSHPLLNKLHENVVWSMRGNFVGIPTDCPQRDERLGWTGDLQVFCRTASFLYDTTSMLSGWLQDVDCEQANNGDVPPMVVPDVIGKIYEGPPDPVAIWGDVTVTAPLDLYESSGDVEVLSQQYRSMYSWLEKGIPRDEDSLWGRSCAENHQLGDWLDPYAPPEFPGDGRTDPYLVADAYLVHVTRKMGQVCLALGKFEKAAEFEQDAQKLRQKYRERYVAKSGRTVSDSQTALALALHFDLLSSDQRKVAFARLVELVRANVFKVGTGFAGTPIILHVLAENGRLDLAYRMLQEKQCPSWLYCVSMGASTTWERWDSMRPDGSINPGEMTSFNHYALGAVASFMHEVIGGLSPLAPGWKHFRIAPRPGGTVTAAESRHLSPYGLIRCSWRLEEDKMLLDVSVPPNTTAVVEVGTFSSLIGSGDRRFELNHTKDPRWPPKPIWRSITIPLVDEIA